MSLAYSAVVGKKEEWGAFVTNALDLTNNVFMAWLPMGSAPAQARYDYQAESYKAPARNSHPDNVTVTGATSAGEDRVQLSALIQYSTKAATVGKLQQDYGNNAAVTDELSKEITKQTTELRNDMENAMLSAQECRVGVSGTTGYLTRGVPNWIQASAQSVLPVDSTQWPSSAQISTTATASVTEDTILGILQGMGTVTQSNETVTGFAGPSARRVFNNFPNLFPSATGANAIADNKSVIVASYQNPIRGKAFDRGISRYITPFGFEVDLVTSWKNYGLDSSGVAQTGTTYNSHSVLFLHQSKWEFRWGDKPNWIRKAYEGGKLEAFCETVWQLVCLTPRGEGKYAPAT